MRSSAFSLIELSIVLVILGLLTGGILAGQSLIRAAELRSVTTQSERYLTTVYTFRDKYFTLPGDMANATQFWGAASTNQTTCRTTDSRTLSDAKLTCDGNGNGTIGESAGGYTFERFRFWHHLANAGLIEGSYSGIIDSGSTLDATPNFNVPAAKIPNAGFSLQYSSTSPEFFSNFSGYSHVIYVGGERAGNTYAPIFVPSEVWNIDTKLDDGNPAMGRIQSSPSTSAIIPNCTTSTDSATAAYSLSLSDKLCAYTIIPGF